MSQSRAALTTIATLIPIAMIVTIYTGRTALRDRQEHEKITVTASFYPLYEFASKVVGNKAEVSSLIPAGVESHEWEPPTEDISRGHTADVVIINGAGFERWTNDLEAKVVVDTSEGIELNSKKDNEAANGKQEQEGNADGDNRINPHIWLDPIFAKHQVSRTRDAVVRLEFANAIYYNQNTDGLTAKLDSLDAFIRSELADCGKLDFIAFHDAFSDFSEWYDLRQHSIQGVSSEGETLPQTMQQIIKLANEFDINVIYSEDLIDSRLSEAITNEISYDKVSVQSPIEGIDKVEQVASLGYIDKMKQNVENLKEGLECR